jgi:lysophospholipase L1-like esterase
MRYLVIIFSVCSFIVLAVMTPDVASAQSSARQPQPSYNDCDPLLSGLWEGANLLLYENVCVKRSQQPAKRYQTKPITPTVPRTQKYNPADPESKPQQPVQETRRISSGMYVGLGDSIAAGAGLNPSYRRQYNACSVSDMSYVTIVASRLQKQHINMSCSGARAADLSSRSIIGRNAQSQIDRAFAYGVPDIITISAGANDMRWSSFISKCFYGQCGTRVDNAATEYLRNSVERRLGRALQDIQTMSNGQSPQVIMTGYYQPLSSVCTQTTSQISADEVKWINRQTELLNNTIRRVANRYNNVQFAPVIYQGRELCTNNPLIQNLQDSAPFHPTAEGQQVIARSVLQLLPIN